MDLTSPQTGFRPSLDAVMDQELARLEAIHLRRQLRVVGNGEPVVNFGGNDYLGLARHPELKEASIAAIGDFGTGAGASRLISGTSRAVLDLEQQLADWKQTEAALVFSSGFAAALGTIPALVGPGDVVILDKLSHASLIDAAKLSGATLRVFPHNRIDRLAAILQRVRSTDARSSGSKARHVLVVTESIFSMDGDAALLKQLVELKEQYGAWLMVDEAHATGLYGPTGAGLISEHGVTHSVEVILGTFSKALGSVGGYIAGSQKLKDGLVNQARSFIYSTALPPAVIAASAAAVRVARSHEGITLRTRLWENVEKICKAMPMSENTALRPSDPSLALVPRHRRAIQPLICGEENRALEFASHFFTQGIYIPGIRYPTVPRGQARLRLTVSAAHAPEQLDLLIKTMGGKTFCR